MAEGFSAADRIQAVGPTPVRPGEVRRRAALDRRRLAMFVVGLPVYFALCMFLPACTWKWPQGWLFIGVFLTMTTAAAISLWRVNPDVVIARMAFHKGTKRWDKILLWFLLPTMYAVLPAAAIDERFHAFPAPTWACAVGYVLFAAGMAIITWAASVNKFFEVTVRIQTERGHQVVDAGPYRMVRHPGYVGGVLYCLGTALCLGSMWALVPAGIAVALLVARTKYEDQTLQSELPGYGEYAKRVRFRLIPGVW